jgi:hypothetical protein
MPSQKTRAYIYRILIALGALAVGYGLVTPNELALWLGVTTAILNILPAVNTSTKE